MKIKDLFEKENRLGTILFIIGFVAILIAIILMSAEISLSWILYLAGTIFATVRISKIYKKIRE